MFGVITDLHGLKIGNMGADPFCKLGTGQVPTLDPVAFVVIMGHASNKINDRKGARQNGQRLAQRSSSQGKVVAVRAGTSL